MSDPCNSYVYVIEGENGLPCYIGVGRGNRVDRHLKDAKAGRHPGNSRVEYLRDCLKRGFVPPVYKIAEDLSVENALAYEATLVAWYGRRDIGTGCLFNAVEGGFGGKNLGPLARSRISKALMGHSVSAEARAKMRAALLNMTPERRARISETQRGRVHSLAERAKRSASLKGRPTSEEHRKNLSAALKGRKITWGHKVAATLKGKSYLTSKGREKLRLARAGKKDPPERRAKMSLVAREREARKREERHDTQALGDFFSGQ